MRQKLPCAAVVVLVFSGACSRGASSIPLTASPFSPSPSGAAAQTSCQTIVNNTGTLTLKQDLSGPDASCLRFSGGSGVLDCQGHDVQSIDLSDVHGMTIRNCRMRGLNATRSSEVIFADNIVTADARKSVAATVRFAEGANNRIVQNTIDGGWRGQPYPLGGYPPGADDGIVIENEANTAIDANVIRNVWDCGIERLGRGTDAIAIRNNDISNAAECGIGSWFAAGWRDSLIIGNTVSASGAFAEIYYSAAQNKGVNSLTLRNNIFEDNHFSNPMNRTQPSVSIDYGTAASKMPIDVANNVFRNNDFGSDIPAPRLAPTAGFIDGGANICGQDRKSALNCVR